MALVTDHKSYSPWPITTVVVLSSAAMTLLQASPESWQLALRFDRDAITGGQWWRLLSGHFIHLGWSHLALNLAGLWLGTWLFAGDRAPARWIAATCLAALACGLGLWLFSPQVRWCVGLSGVLHGLMIVGFGGWALAGDRMALGLLALVVGKMTWEQLGGDMPWSESLAGGNVVIDAHLWGAAGGAVYLLAEWLWRRRKRPV